MRDASNISYRKASADDLPQAHILLENANLPTEGLGGIVDTLLVAVDDERVVGAAGIELYGSQGLLRSVVVKAEFRGLGIGERLVEKAIDVARKSGVRELYLLTEGAADYFERHEFRSVARDDVAGPVRASAEFSYLCPSTAVAMVRELTD